MTTLRLSQFEIPDGVIDLGLGQPDRSVYPVEAMREASAAVLGGHDHEFLQYGAEYGERLHRLALATFLTDAYGVSVDPEHVLTTNGNSHALDVVCTLFTRPGDVVVVEDPTYFFAPGIFADHGLTVVGVPLDGEGIDTAALAERLSALRAAGTPARFVYCIPSSQNPTGISASAARRRELVDLAHEHDLLIVADEVYHLLEYGPPGPPPMSAYADSGRVLSLGTFSKILSPGLRLGWIHAAPPLLARIADCGLVISGGGFNPFTSAIATHVIESGSLAQNIAALCTEYSHRLHVVDEALRRHMPADVSWTAPTGGYFVWLNLPAGVDGSAVRQAGRESGVDVRQGSLFAVSGNFDSHLRLCIARYRADDLGEGIARLGTAVRAVLS
ncbi:MAG: PLP-dependent aminotransferase family protein [Ilumatobacteraceae bacterium]